MRNRFFSFSLAAAIGLGVIAASPIRAAIMVTSDSGTFGNVELRHLGDGNFQLTPDSTPYPLNINADVVNGAAGVIASFGSP